VSLPAVVRLRNYRHYPSSDANALGVKVNWLDYSAPEGNVFVAIVLGTENKDGSDPLPLMEFVRMLEIDGVAVTPSEPLP
jgi:hypothetical protein